VSWPIGYVPPPLQLEVADDQALLANGVRVTADHGWINVSLPAEARMAGTPAVVSLRLGLQRDRLGVAVLVVEELTLGPQRYATLRDLSRRHPDPWVSALEPAIRAEIVRRVDHGKRPPAPRSQGRWPNGADVT
jgi:hypothetical protein